MNSVGKLKGQIKNDKRKLEESSKNLVVLGVQQVAAADQQRPMRRNGSTLRRVTTKYRSPTSLVPEPGRTLRRLLQKDGFGFSNDFTKTKPWRLKTDSNSYESSETILSVTGIGTNRITTISSKEVTPSSQKSVREKIAEIVSVVSPPKVNSKTPGGESAKEVMPDPTMLSLPPEELEEAKTLRKMSILCPVCSKGLQPNLLSRQVPAADAMKVSFQAYETAGSGAFRKTLEDGWGPGYKRRRTVEAQNVVVAANCGELYHKVCLRDLCCRLGKSPRSPRFSAKGLCICPSCSKELKYTTCQEIDAHRSFSSEPTELEKQLNKTKLINMELLHMLPDVTTYLAKLRRDVEEKTTVFAAIRSKRRDIKDELKQLTAEDLSVVMARVTDVATLKDSLAKQSKALDFMQQETLQIMRIYLLTVMRRLKVNYVQSGGEWSPSPGELETISKVPTSLIPHIHKILSDDQALAILARIVVPRINDAMDHAAHELLACQILERYDSASEIIPRTKTYTVLSSNGEGEETGEEDEDEEEETMKSSSAPEESESEMNEMAEVGDESSNLKLSPATHGIPVISSPTQIVENLEAVPPLNNDAPSSWMSERPPQLLQVMEIGESDLQINSSASIIERVESLGAKEEEADPQNVVSSESSRGQLLLFKRTSSLDDSSGSSTITPSEVARRYPSLAMKDDNLRKAVSEPAPSSAEPESDVANIKERQECFHQNTQTIANASLPRTPQKVKKAKKKIPSPAPKEEAPDEENENSWSTISNPTVAEGNPEDNSWCTISDDEGIQMDNQIAFSPQVAEKDSSVESCRMVYSAVKNDNNNQANTTTGPPQKLSITILYLVDSDEEAKQRDQEDDKQVISEDKERLLSPVFMHADKTSKYSVVANEVVLSQNSSSTEGGFAGVRNNSEAATNESLSESESWHLQELRQLRYMQSLPLPPLPYVMKNDRERGKKSAFFVESLPVLPPENAPIVEKSVSIVYENETASTKVSTSSQT